MPVVDAAPTVDHHEEREICLSGFGRRGLAAIVGWDLVRGVQQGLAPAQNGVRAEAGGQTVV